MACNTNCSQCARTMGEIPFLPAWLDPTISERKREALELSAQARAERRSRGELDYLSEAEAQYLPPMTVNRLQQDVNNYNVGITQGNYANRQSNQAATWGILGLAAVAGFFILKGK